MPIRVLTYAALLAALPASAQEAALDVDLIPGHPIHHERQQEAGIAMALSITPEDRAANLMALCDELRTVAGLGHESGDELRLETIFVVPYKGMAVEGLYLPRDGTSESDRLARGEDLARPVLDRIVAQAGIPPRILDEPDVEQEISCSPHEPVWSITWSDVRRIGDEAPEAVIARAHERFLAVHRSVVEHNATGRHLQKALRAADGG